MCVGLLQLCVSWQQAVGYYCALLHICSFRSVSVEVVNLRASGTVPYQTMAISPDLTHDSEYAALLQSQRWISIMVRMVVSISCVCSSLFMSPDGQVLQATSVEGLYRTMLNRLEVCVPVCMCLYHHTHTNIIIYSYLFYIFLLILYIPTYFISQFLPVYIFIITRLGTGSSWYKTHIIAWEILVFYAIYMATRPRGFALVLVPVYFTKHSVSCYIYYVQIL